MITIQSNKKVESITIFCDSQGIDELIDFLNFIKVKDASFHLNIGNELEEAPFDNELFVISHAKVMNIDKLAS